MEEVTVARRYAEAYVNALEKAGRLEAGLKELKAVAQVYMGSEDLKHFLGSPEISTEEKKALLEKLFSDSVGPQGMGLIQLLLRWDRTELLGFIGQEIEAIAQAHQGIVHGTVATVRPISSEETETIARMVGKRLGKQVILERQVKPELLGGVQVTVGTTLLDGSVQRRLRNVSETFKNIKVN